MSVIAVIITEIYPRLIWVGRVEKTTVDVTYRVGELDDLKSKVEWYTRPEIKKYVTCIRFGLRSNLTLRELASELTVHGRLPTKIAAAVEMMLR